jgi:hypothetical protein
LARETLARKIENGGRDAKQETHKNESPKNLNPPNPNPQDARLVGEDVGAHRGGDFQNLPLLAL